ncbi:MAG: hypothetical protein HUJ91_07560 [Bacteroidales bacterium]|nr:hypothetical protein [Bacteroidales bacterium]
MNLFTKLTYDYNQNPESGECCVLPDTELLQIGFGAEYLPIKGSEALRLFAAGSTTGGRNGNIYGTLADSLTLFELGLKVQCGLFSSARH